MPRIKLKPLVTEDGTTYRCEHESNWPPGHARVGDSFVYMRDTGLVSENDYQRLLVWQRICGLMQMDEAKCLTCPHVRLVAPKGKLVAVNNVDGTPLVLPPFVRRPKDPRYQK